MPRKKGNSGKDEKESEHTVLDERYRLLFETSQDAIMLLDRDRFFDCNPATLKMFGLTKEIFIKLHPSEISPPRQPYGNRSREEADLRISEAFEKGTIMFEWVHRRSNGEDFAVTVWLTAFTLEGKPVLQATVREISSAEESQSDLESQRLKLQMLLNEKSGEYLKESGERKKAEGDLRKLIAAVETSFNAVALFDMDMKFIYANAAFCNLAGVERKDLETKKATHFVPDESLDLITDQIERNIAGEKLERLEVKAFNSQGSDLWVEIAGSVLFGEDGEPEGLLAIINDITEKKRILGMLTERSKILESMSEGVIAFGKGGLVTDVNPAYERITGFTRSDVIGKSGPEIAAKIIDSAVLEDVLSLFQASLSGKKVRPLEVDILRKDGGKISILLTTSPIGDDSDGSTVIAVMQDITVIKNAQAALIESEEKFKMMVERSLDGVVILQDGKVAYMNPSLVKLSGYTLKEQIGRDFIENIAPEEREKVMGYYRARMEGKELPSIYQIHISRKDGIRVPIEINAAAMEYDGKTADFVYVRDLSERFRIEEDIKALKERFEFVLGVTHTGFDIIDENLNVIYVDPAWAKTLGDYSGRKCHEYFMGLDSQCRGCAIPEALRKGERVISEEYLEKEKRHIEVHTIPFRGNDGKWLVAEFNIDITERKKMMMTLQESEQKFRNLAENSPNMIFINRGGRVVYANKMCSELMGYTQEEFLSETFNLMKIIHKDYHLLIRDNLKRHFTGEDIPPYEYKLVTKEGKVLDAIISTKTVEHEGEISILGIVTDISDIKRIHWEMQANETRYRELAEGISSGLAVYEAVDSGKDFVFRDFNRAAELIEGVKKKDVIGRRVTEVFPGIREMGLLKVFKRVWKTGVPESFPTALYKGEHVPSWRENYVYRLPTGEVAAIYNDITERRKAEEELRNFSEQLKNISDNLADGMVYQINCGPDNSRREFSYISSAVERMHGVKAEDAIQNPMLIYGQVMEEDLKLLSKAEKHAFETMEKLEFEARVRLPSGDLRWRHFVSLPRKLANGDVVWDGIELDITERKSAELALKESNEKLQSLFNSIEDLIFGFDADGRFITYHSTENSTLYAPPDIFIGKKHSDVLPPDVSKMLEKAFRKNRARETMDFEYSLELNGETMCFSAKMSPIFIEDEFRGSVAVVRDITERKKTEEELISQREQLNALFQASTNGIGVEKDGRLFFVNPSFQRMFGYSEGEIIGKPLVSIVSPSDRKRVKGYSKQRLTGQAPQIYEFTGLRKDGTTFDAEASVSVYKIGKETYYVGFVQDITERKRAQQSIQESEARFRRMAENIHDGLTIIENGKVSYINDRAAEIYGYPKEELMNMSQTDLIIPEDRDQMKAIIEKALKKTEKPGELEFWIQAKDGSRKYVRTRMSTSYEEGNVSEFIITTDITARKQAEEENKRRLMKFLLEDGRIYLVKEFKLAISVDAFNDLLNLEYFGMVLSRTPKKDLMKSIHGPFDYYWLGEAGDERGPFDEIISAVGKIGGKCAILIDRLDYLIIKYGFDSTMRFIFSLRDQIYAKDQVVIISVDASTISEEHLVIMQKEMSEVERREVPRPSEELFEIAQLIYERNSAGTKPSFSEIGEELKLSKPTFRKRVRKLINEGYAVEVTKGNRKVLELTQKGRSLFFK